MLDDNLIDFAADGKFTKLYKSFPLVIEAASDILDGISDLVAFPDAVFKIPCALPVKVPVLLLVLCGASSICRGNNFSVGFCLFLSFPHKGFNLGLKITSVASFGSLSDEPSLSIPTLQGGLADIEKILGFVNCE